MEEGVCACVTLYVCVHACVCVCVYMYVCVCVCSYTCVYVCVSVITDILSLYQEVLLERLRKHGMDTPFGLFLKSETTRMAECLQGIHSSLQVQCS